MRIDKSRAPSGISKAGGSAKSGKSQGKKRSGDQVQVTDASGLRAAAHAMLADMPDVRLERIEEIRGQLENGTFQSDNRKVAVQIVSNALAEYPW